MSVSMTVRGLNGAALLASQSKSHDVIDPHGDFNFNGPTRINKLPIGHFQEYRGERVSPPPGFDHGAERRGRIPNAEHLFFRELVNEDDSFLPPAELQARLSGVGITRDAGKEIVVYCRLSHRASLAWFALTVILDYESVKIYDGSWTEWGSIVGFPVEK